MKVYVVLHNNGWEIRKIFKNKINAEKWIEGIEEAWVGNEPPPYPPYIVEEWEVE